MVIRADLLHPKKVGSLPVSDQEVKRTNEIKTAIPLLDAIDIEGKEITADALLTQRDIADYLVLDRKAHYHFTVKNNQPAFFRILRYTSMTAKTPILSLAIRRITDSEFSGSSIIWG